MLLSDLKSFVQTHRNKGRGEAFGFDDNTTETYLKWAFMHDYLFISHDSKRITGIGIAYPFDHDSYENSGEQFSFKNAPLKSEEHKHDLCIMDIATDSEEATKSLVLSFKKRYPHWHLVKKWGLRFGESKEISNQYINLL